MVGKGLAFSHRMASIYPCSAVCCWVVAVACRDCGTCKSPSSSASFGKCSTAGTCSRGRQSNSFTFPVFPKCHRGTSSWIRMQTFFAYDRHSLSVKATISQKSGSLAASTPDMSPSGRESPGTQETPPMATCTIPCRISEARRKIFKVRRNSHQNSQHVWGREGWDGVVLPDSFHTLNSLDEVSIDTAALGCGCSKELGGKNDRLFGGLRVQRPVPVGDRDVWLDLPQLVLQLVETSSVPGQDSGCSIDHAQVSSFFG